jgi:hypothetical protein
MVFHHLGTENASQPAMPTQPAACETLDSTAATLLAKPNQTKPNPTTLVPLAACSRLVSV